VVVRLACRLERGVLTMILTLATGFLEHPLVPDGRARRLCARVESSRRLLGSGDYSLLSSVLSSSSDCCLVSCSIRCVYWSLCLTLSVVGVSG